MLYNTIRIRM